MDQKILVNFSGQVVEILQFGHIAQGREGEREGGQSLLSVDELVSLAVARNVGSLGANQRPEEMLRILSAFDQRYHILVEIVPLLFRPRILALEERNEELVS